MSVREGKPRSDQRIERTTSRAMGITYRPRVALVRTAAKFAPGYRSRIFRSRLNPRRHRWATGGSWEEMGKLQLDFLVRQGLEPSHQLLDVGCGALRGGVQFVEYLDAGHYCGIDKNAAFIKAGRCELEAAGLADRGAVLLEDDAFRFSRFGRRFDFAIAQSVFTHLNMNSILRCLSEIEPALEPGGRFYATFFRNPGPRLRSDPVASRYHTTHVDRDPYCYDPDFFTWVVEGSGLEADVLGDWSHPRGQEMVVFTRLA